MWITDFIEGIGSFHFIRPEPHSNTTAQAHTHPTSIHSPAYTPTAMHEHHGNGHSEWDKMEASENKHGNEKERYTTREQKSANNNNTNGNTHRLAVYRVELGALNRGSEREWQREVKIRAQWMHETSELTTMPQISDSANSLYAPSTTTTTTRATTNKHCIWTFGTSSRNLSLEISWMRWQRIQWCYRRIFLAIMHTMCSEGVHAKVCIFTISTSCYAYLIYWFCFGLIRLNVSEYILTQMSEI